MAVNWHAKVVEHLGVLLFVCYVITLLLCVAAAWDNMRFIARKRYEEGIMPSWFNPEWLDVEEAPTNTWWRQQGLSAYKQDTSWLGENAPSTSSSGGDGGSGSGIPPWGTIAHAALQLHNMTS